MCENKKHYTLLKFRAINWHLINSLVNSELYFAPREKFNDPFDCQIDPSALLEGLISKSTNQEQAEKLDFIKNMIVDDKFNEGVSRLGICAFCGGEDEGHGLYNRHLWDHYAEGYKGVCLTYRFTDEQLLAMDETAIANKAFYSDEDLIRFLLCEKHFSNQSELFLWFLAGYLSIKDECYREEHEVRIIAGRQGCIEILRENLVQVCFGLRTSDEDKKLIKNIIELTGYNRNLVELKKQGNGLVAVEI